ncbi:hypothetical protein ACLB2K_074842 [Fragaria x ananassa]
MAQLVHSAPTYVCATPAETASRGFWFHEDPLDYTVPATLAQVILVIVTFRLLYFLLKPLGQTKLTCHLLAGIILGPSLVGRNQFMRDKLLNLKDASLWAIMGLLGATLSMFVTAVKFDIRMARRTKLSFKIAPALDELNLMNSELGQIAMSSALHFELIQWLFSTVQDIATKEKASYGALTFISAVAMAAFIVLVIRPLMVSIVEKTPQGQQEVKEHYVVAILVGARIRLL